MKRYLSVALLVLGASLIGISSSNAVTVCPTGTSVSTTNPDNCIANIKSYTPTDLGTQKVCNLGDTYNSTTGKCDIPSKVIPAGSTYDGIPQYNYSCNPGDNFYSATQCQKLATITPLPVLSPGTDCLGNYFYGADRVCHLISSYITVKEADSGIFQNCPTGTTREGAYCVYPISTNIIYDANRTISQYYCNATVNAQGQIVTYGNTYTQATISCTGSSSYTQTFPSYSPVTSYTGTCATYYTFSKSDGKCNAYEFSPAIPVTSTSIVYKCSESSWNQVPKITYFAYDASLENPFGLTRTCSPFTTVIPTTSTDGLYVCQSVSIDTNISYYFASDTDKTSTTTKLVTTCDFVPTEYGIDIPVDDFYQYAQTSDCDSISWYPDWLACESAKYV